MKSRRSLRGCVKLSGGRWSQRLQHTETAGAAAAPRAACLALVMSAFVDSWRAATVVNSAFLAQRGVAELEDKKMSGTGGDPQNPQRTCADEVRAQ